MQYTEMSLSNLSMMIDRYHKQMTADISLIQLNILHLLM